jgi:RNA polymerase sigma-70 factor (ECF subfamily)
MNRSAPAPVQIWWTEHRHLVRDVAYRMLGSIADAEDVTQDTYLRLLAQDPAGIDNPRAWLVTVASRLSVDRLRSHERSRRADVGPWLPEPLVSGELTPEDRITLDDSVRMALLVVLERLNPEERTAFVLHDVFQLDFATIAGILGGSTAGSRQLASRARRKIKDGGARRLPADPVTARTLAERFARACADGDLDGLVAALTADVHGDFDSGGLIPGAPTVELRGAEAVARQLLAGFAGVQLDFAAAEVNGEPGVVVRRNGRVVTVLALGLAAGGIATIHAVGNPDKLRHLQTDWVA